MNSNRVWLLLGLSLLAMPCRGQVEQTGPWVFDFPKYSIDLSSQRVYHADLDMDGDQDVIMALGGVTGMVGVCMNLGNKQFSDVVEYHAGRGIKDIDFTDIDLDGDPDMTLVFQYETGTVIDQGLVILINQGQGVFGDRIEVDTWRKPVYVRCGDLDGDSDIDLVVAHYLPGGIGVSLNSGNGIFEPMTMEASIRETRSLELGDVDGDGDLDILALPGNFYGGSDTIPRVYLNDGTGSIVSMVTMPGSNAHHALDVSFSDVDLDGTLDVVALNRGGFSDPPSSVGVYRGVGDSSFEPMRAYYEGEAVFFQLDIEDLDMDGAPDIVLSESTDFMDASVHMLRNQGDGSFVFDTSVVYPSRVQTVSPVDIDNDHDFDLLSLSWPDGFMLSENLNGVFESSSVFSTNQEPNQIEAVDMNADSIPDLVVCNTDRNNEKISVYIGNGLGSFVAGAEIPVGRNPQGMKVQDINGDNWLDVVAVNQGSTFLSVAIGQSDGSFSPAANYTTLYRGLSIDMGDVGCDGFPDVVLAEWIAITVYENFAGFGVFMPAVEYPVEAGTSAVALADLNDDGSLDIVATNELTNTVAVLLNSGCGGFGSPVLLNTDSEPVDVFVEDLDQDGEVDLIVSHMAGASVSIFYGNGDGTFAQPITIDTVNGAAQAVSLDADQDGDLDIAVSVPSNNDVLVILNGGGRAYAMNHTYKSRKEPVALVAADFNLDGVDDIAVTGFANGVVGVMMNRYLSGACPADLTGDGNLNFFDVSAFLVAFNAGDTLADFTGDGFFNFFDVSAFLVAFAAGCP